MEVQDYEYYEAHAEDVKLEDITSDEDNADVLARLLDNKSYCIYLSIATEREDDFDFVVREGDDLGWLGYFVGRSQRLESLFIDNIPENINLDAFFKGLQLNRSIQELHISTDLGESFQSLIPFVKDNDNLHHLNFNSFDIGLQCAHNVAMLLSQQSSWKRLSFDETVLDHEGLKQTTAALRSQPQIEELRINGNSVGRNGYAALGKALEGCLSLRKLDLAEYDNNVEDERLVDDEGMNALLEGLKYCHNLTSLNLYGNLIVTEEGLRSLSTLFQSDNCRLDHLDLGRMNIDNDEAVVLATGLASLPSLRQLKLQGMSIGNQGLQHLARGLVNCNLEELDMSRSMLMDSVSGLRSLGTLVGRKTNIHWLNLSDTSLSDEGLQSFVEGMENCCNLTKLSLSKNRLITANGLASLSSLFRAENVSLCTLYLYDIHLGDDGAVALTNGLIGNKSLTHLGFDSSSITARGWVAFSKLLCDTSSVNSTYLSNHTLQHVGNYYGWQNTPSDIEEYLKLNRSLNQAAAICKILRSHPDIDVAPLFEFNLKCLPLVVEWLEKAKSYLWNLNTDELTRSCIDKVNESSEAFQRRQLSAVYKFIRGMPLLAVNGFRSQNMKDNQSDAKKKRKFDLTL